jgi:hypothetical protein
MSKRVANTKNVTARNGRVRVGWQKRKKADQLTQMRDQLKGKEADDQLKATLDGISSMIGKLLPKRLIPNKARRLRSRRGS